MNRLSSNDQPTFAVVRAPTGRLHRFWRRAAGDPTFLAAVTVVLLLVAAAVLAPWIAPHEPAAQSLSARLLPPAWASGGNLEYPLGTDPLGRDILSRLLFAARSSLLVSLSVVGASAILGGLVGLVAGMYGGLVDEVTMRITDIMLAFPGLLLSMTVMIMLGSGTSSLCFALILRGWMIFARVIRGATLVQREADYVQAAVSLGARDIAIMLRHILPNVSTTIFTLAVLELSRVLLAESSLSFLGFGIQPPALSWGLMLAEARSYLFVSVWQVALPGLTIMLCTLSFNLLSGSIRTLLDPLQASSRNVKSN